MATLPLHSWRMAVSLLRVYQLETRSEPEHRDGAGFGAAVEADAASGAAFALVMRGMHAVGTQVGREFQALGRARLHTQPASFAFINIDCDVAPCLRCHIHLVTGSFTGRCNHLVRSQ